MCFCDSTLTSFRVFFTQGTICLVYATAAQDMSSSIIINFHMNVQRAPDVADVLVWPLDDDDGGGGVAEARVYEARCLKMHVMPERRVVCWADVSALAAGRRYAARPRALFRHDYLAFSLPVAVLPDAAAMTFSTGSVDKPFSFVVGGDYEVSRIVACRQHYR
jgi:hypothetical protein